MSLGILIKKDKLSIPGRCLKDSEYVYQYEGYIDARVFMKVVLPLSGTEDQHQRCLHFPSRRGKRRPHGLGIHVTHGLRDVATSLMYASLAALILK